VEEKEWSRGETGGKRPKANENGREVKKSSYPRKLRKGCVVEKASPEKIVTKAC